MEKSAEKLAIPKPKNGLFDSYEDIKLYYNHHKAKYPKDEHIPIVLSHVKREKEWQLYKADPKQKINFVLSTIIRKIG